MESRITVIITGESGYIARNLANALNAESNIHVLTTDCPPFKDFHRGDRDGNCLLLDLRSPSKFDYGRINRGDLVVHLASVSSPDICKKNYDLARKINVTGTCEFIKKCLKRDGRVLFFSSDTVYGIGSGLFDEKSPCSPVGVYATMKYEVEKEFESEDAVKVFRLSYVFSREDKFMQYLARCGRNNVPAKIYHPFCRNVVYLRDVLDSVRELDVKWNLFDSKTFNICGRELISRKDIAGYYRDIVSGSLRMELTEPEESFFNERPRTIRTRSLYLEKLLGRNPWSIKKAMTEEFKS